MTGWTDLTVEQQHLAMSQTIAVLTVDWTDEQLAAKAAQLRGWRQLANHGRRMALLFDDLLDRRVAHRRQRAS